MRRLLQRFLEFFMTRLIIAFRQPTLHAEIVKYTDTRGRKIDGRMVFVEMTFYEKESILLLTLNPYNMYIRHAHVLNN